MSKDVKPTDRPQANARPRASTRDRLRVVATTHKLQAVEGDWLFGMVSAQGRKRLLVEHDLLPRDALSI